VIKFWKWSGTYPGCFILFIGSPVVRWLKTETEVGKTSYSAVREMKAVVSLCGFQCGVAEVCECRLVLTVLYHY